MSEYKLTAIEYNEKVANSALPVLIDFYATWCGPCRMLSPVIEEIAKEYEGKIKVYKVDVDEEGELANEFGISSIPTLVVVKNGEVVEKATGYRPKEAVLSLVLDR